MEHKNNIRNLIAKFNKSQVDNNELAELLHYIKDDQPGKEIDSFYEDVWTDKTGLIHGVSSKEMYRSILYKTSLQAKRSSEIKIRTLLPFMRYAAIFILAFGLSWVAHNALNKIQTNANPVVYQKVEVPYGSKTRLQLPDGSRVILNSGSTLSYPTTFNGNFRMVYLTGEAFFDVKKDKSKPFFVNAAGMKIKVLGTTFNVKAYAGERTIETTLITGEVQIFTGMQLQTPDMVLRPNQKAVFNLRNKKIAKLDDNTPQTTDMPLNVLHEKKKMATIQPLAKIVESVAWKDNQLIFDNEEFESLKSRIERWFNVEIVLKDPDLKNARFSGKFDKETVEQAMDAMVLATSFRYTINKNKITIYK